MFVIVFPKRMGFTIVVANKPSHQSDLFVVPVWLQSTENHGFQTNKHNLFHTLLDGSYTYGHLFVISGYKWDYRVNKWGYKML